MSTIGTDPTAPAPVRPRHAWVSYAALVAGAGLLLKALLIIGSGNQFPDAPLGVLYLVSIAVAVAAAIGTGLRQRRGRRTVVAVGLSLLVIAWVMVLSDLTTPVFELFSDASHVSDEGPVGLLGLALLVLGARARS